MLRKGVRNCKEFQAINRPRQIILRNLYCKIEQICTGIQIEFGASFQNIHYNPIFTILPFGIWSLTYIFSLHQSPQTVANCQRLKQTATQKLSKQCRDWRIIAIVAHVCANSAGAVRWSQLSQDTTEGLDQNSFARESCVWNMKGFLQLPVRHLVCGCSRQDIENLKVSHMLSSSSWWATGNRIHIVPAVRQFLIKKKKISHNFFQFLESIKWKKWHNEDTHAPNEERNDRIDANDSCRWQHMLSTKAGYAYPAFKIPDFLY